MNDTVFFPFGSTDLLSGEAASLDLQFGPYGSRVLLLK